MDKDLNGSQDALKHLEGNIGKALSELNHIELLSAQMGTKKLLKY